MVARPVASLALALVVGGCFETTYRCQADANCTRGDVAGICRRSGADSYCAFPRADCPGGFAWDTSAPPSLVGLCLGGAAADMTATIDDLSMALARDMAKGDMAAAPIDLLVPDDLLLVCDMLPPVFPTHCQDDMLDSDMETDDNCGGECPPCDDDRQCVADPDCKSGLCENQVCSPPSCINGHRDGDETGIDCGGVCKPCQLGDPCRQARDCEPHCDGADSCDSRRCGQVGCNGLGTCERGQCDDGRKNGDESDLDCGGSCHVKCHDRFTCKVDEDCKSHSCVNGLCAASDGGP